MAPSNRKKSTKYTPLTFLPITLFIQYTRIIIIFYTCNGIIQCFPSVSTNSPLASWIPTAFIVLVGILKELYLEIKRYQEDNEVNSKLCQKLSSVDKEGKLHFKQE